MTQPVGGGSVGTVWPATADQRTGWAPDSCHREIVT